MTHQTEPIRKSSLPTTPPPEWEFFTFFPYPDDDGGDMVRGQRQRGVQVRRLVTYGDWEPVRPDRWADEPAPAAVSAAVAPPTQAAAALRDRLIDALANAHHTHPCPELGDKTWSGCVHYDDAGRMLGVGVCHSERRADAVLAVLPEPTDRAAVLADVERAIRAATGSCGYKAEDGCDFCNGVDAALDQLRRMADETATETPAVTVHAAPDLSPAAEEALDALIDVAKQQAVCDFEHPHPEHPCGRRTAGGARQDGAES